MKEFELFMWIYVWCVGVAKMFEGNGYQSSHAGAAVFLVSSLWSFLSNENRLVSVMRPSLSETHTKSSMHTSAQSPRAFRPWHVIIAS